MSWLLISASNTSTFAIKPVYGCPALDPLAYVTVVAHDSDAGMRFPAVSGSAGSTLVPLQRPSARVCAPTAEPPSMNSEIVPPLIPDVLNLLLMFQLFPTSTSNSTPKLLTLDSTPSLKLRCKRFPKASNVVNVLFNEDSMVCLEPSNAGRALNFPPPSNRAGAAW